MLAGVARYFIETTQRIVPAYLYLVVVPFVSIILSVILAARFHWSIRSGVGWWRRIRSESGRDSDFAILGSVVFGFPLRTFLVITGIHHTKSQRRRFAVDDLGGTPICLDAI